MTDDRRKSGRENEPGEEPEYEELFACFSDSAEKLLIRATALLAVLLAVTQAALLIPAVRETLVPAERLEGVPFQLPNSVQKP